MALTFSNPTPGVGVIQVDGTDKLKFEQNGDLTIGGNLGFNGSLSATELLSGSIGGSGDLIFNRDNSEKIRLTNDGKLGIGTDNPSVELVVVGTSAFTSTTNGSILLKPNVGDGHVVRYGGTGTNTNVLRFLGVSDTERMRIDAVGRVGIGVSNPTVDLDVAGPIRSTGSVIAEGDFGTANIIAKRSSSNTTGVFGQLSFHNNDGNVVSGITSKGNGANDQSHLTFHTGSAPSEFAFASPERMRLNKDGYLKIDTDGVYDNAINNNYGANTAFHHITQRINTATVVLNHANAQTPNAINLFSTMNTTSSIHIRCDSESFGNTVFSVDGDGTAKNTNGVFATESDIKLKEGITDATPKLEEISSIRFVNFSLIGKPEYGKQFGVIAQELEEVFPNLIINTPDTEEVESTDGEGNTVTETVETGTVTKSVKYSVLTLMAVKALQELKTEKDDLEEKYNNLLQRVEALESN